MLNSSRLDPIPTHAHIHFLPNPKKQPHTQGARAFTHFPVPATAADAAGNAVLKTGTTIAGVVVDGAVILAADTRWVWFTYTYVVA